MTLHSDLDQLVENLFHVFFRTEYALKASCFNNGAGTAEANWGAFVLAVEAVTAAPSSPDIGLRQSGVSHCCVSFTILRASVEFVLSVQEAYHG